MRCAQERAHHQACRGLVHWYLRIHLPLRGDATLSFRMEVPAPLLLFLSLLVSCTSSRDGVAASPLCLVPSPSCPYHKRYHNRPLCCHVVLLNVRCNSVTLELARAVRVRPRQTRTRPSLRLVLLSPSRSTSSHPRSKKSSTGEYTTLRVFKSLAAVCIGESPRPRPPMCEQKRTRLGFT